MSFYRVAEWIDIGPRAVSRTASGGQRPQRLRPEFCPALYTLGFVIGTAVGVVFVLQSLGAIA